MGKKLDAKEYTVTREAEMKILEQGGRETHLGPMELVDPPEMPAEWSLLIGDFAYNARAALDHLAWELAGSWTWRANRAMRSGKRWPPRLYFPIYAYFKKPSDKQALKRKLGNFSPTHRKAIASAQPHRRDKLGRAEPLWLLDEIRNRDAHRELHTVLANVPFSAVMGWLDKSGFRFPNRLPAGLNVAPGDVLQTTLKIQIKISPYVTFDQRGADFHGQEVLPLLHRCRDEVERILGLF